MREQTNPVSATEQDLLVQSLRTRMEEETLTTEEAMTNRTTEQKQGKHTPGPWKTTPLLHDGIRVHQDNEHGMRDAVADCLHWQTPAETAANAAFIVRACNSHEELLEALKRIVDTQQHECIPESTYCRVDCMWNNAKQVIKKALQK